MIIAETIGKSVEETMQLSVHEIQLWAAHFNIKNKKQNIDFLLDYIKQISKKHFYKSYLSINRMWE